MTVVCRVGYPTAPHIKLIGFAVVRKLVAAISPRGWIMYKVSASLSFNIRQSDYTRTKVIPGNFLISSRREANKKVRKVSFFM
jgi:hypothetical protein